jgi:hypothetical protein
VLCPNLPTEQCSFTTMSFSGISINLEPNSTPSDMIERDTRAVAVIIQANHEQIFEVIRKGPGIPDRQRTGMISGDREIA